jgi:lysophospholipase
VQLIDHPNYPCPSGATVEAIRCADGVTIRTARWPSLARQPLGTICLFHGRSEFIEKYYEIIRDLRSRGFAVATFDWRGQGGSDRLIEDGRLGHIEDFEQYGLDLDAFMRHVALPECPAPFYGLAHSMGSAILFSSLPGRSAWFERLVVTAPMIGLGSTPPAAKFLANALGSMGLSHRIVPGWSPAPVVLKPFLGNPVTSDARRYRMAAELATAEPAIAIGGPTIAWVRAAFRLMDRLRSPGYGAPWRLPTLAVLAGEDRVVSSPVAGAFVETLRASHAITLPGALHEIMQERDDLRNRFWAAFDSFVPGSAATGSASLAKAG